MPQENSSTAKSGFFSRLPITVYRLLLPIVFLYLLWSSWRRWTSSLADTGREMDLPLRLLNGELLYRDVQFMYPPFSPYFNALLYKIFGARLEVLNIEGVMCAVIIAALCFVIARKILPERETVLATLTVIVWCIFKPEGNLIGPYSFSALHGMLFALATVLVTLRYKVKRAWQEIIGAGIFIGLAGITKQEFGLASAVTWSAGILFLYRGDWQKLLGRIFFPAAISLLIALPVYGYFLSRVGWQILIEDCHLLYTHIPPSLVFYNAIRTGVDHPFLSFLQMIGGAAVAFAFAALVALFSFGKTIKRNLLRQCVVVFLSSATVAVVVGLLARGRWDGSPLRALPFALVGLMLVHFFRKDEAKPQFELFVIATYSLIVLLRVALRVPSGGAFGGYFLPTSLILIVYLATVAFPDFVASFSDKNKDENNWKAEPLLRPKSLQGRVKIAFTGLLSLWLLITIFVFGFRYRKSFPALIEAPHGSWYVTKDTAKATQEVVDFMRENAAPEDAVAVVPEGSSLAFLTGHRMPLRHQILLPDFMDADEEQRAIAVLKQTKFVCVVNRPMREFGKESFGQDFYQAMGRELAENFQVVKVCGEVKAENLPIGYPQFFIKILRRK